LDSLQQNDEGNKNQQGGYITMKLVPTKKAKRATPVAPALIVENLPSFPPNSNPFLHDTSSAGGPLPFLKNILFMHNGANHMYLVNELTGKRVAITFTPDFLDVPATEFINHTTEAWNCVRDDAAEEDSPS
jgi:hypothetical protein